jgi:hypothetical protein
MAFHTSMLFFSATEYGLIRVHYILATFGIHLAIWTLQFDPTRGLALVLPLVSNFGVASDDSFAGTSPNTPERRM